MEKIEKCDKCKRNFARKFTPRQGTWSKMNEVEYWTDGKNWNGYKIVCRSCLKDWKIYSPDEFMKLVSPEKRERYSSYLYSGLFDRKDLV
jgi:hypothetical protein